MLKTLVLLLAILFAGCGSKQTQDTTQTVHAQEATLEASQEAVQASGANVRENTGTVHTENVTGISPYWFVVGALAFGIILPRPKFIKLLF